MPLWVNDRGDFYCSDCRVYNDEKYDVAICLVCNKMINPEDEEVPILIFSKPTQIFCEKCFQELLKLGIVALKWFYGKLW